MTKWRPLLVVTSAALTLAGLASAAEPPRATVREYTKVLRTYPYSDPNPIPVVGRIYPYFRFDGYTDTPVDREWKVVELENAYLRVIVLPEIGGKIWTAIEKSTGRSFIYDNHVVKFRDIALRGPWTSGGIEANYGIIGHTPNCATPVDYTARVGADGSASVIIGTLDLLTRTPWRLEISLPADTAYFTTRSWWHNATPLEQPYYTWMNAGIRASGNLELVYPGTHHIGHGGEVSPWPLDRTRGRNLAFYAQNDFGPYKSYHVLGRHSEFFGAYWHDDDFGMGHYARRDDKLGKKAWIWGLSRQGMIWEKLLTDTDGQYVELQSGRLFNQAAEQSTFSPFKHRGFAPHSTDTWTEYWFPVKGTRGFVLASDYGALNVELPGAQAGAPARKMTLRFSPLQRIADTLEVLDGDRVVYSVPLSLEPMQAWTRTIDAAVPASRLRVRIGGARFEYRPAADDELSRPVESPKDFDWGSAFGLWLAGKEWMRQREYGRAQDALEACLRKDRHYVPALADLAGLRCRALDASGAWDYARRALAIDAYDPAANYYYGLASRMLGRRADAMDGFEVAASSSEFRVAAWTELARMYLAAGDYRSAEEYAARSVEADPMNVEGCHLAALAQRLRGDRGAAAAMLDKCLALDPLDHLARFERSRLDGANDSLREFSAGIRNEMPHETFLELAAWYRGVGRLEDARHLLELSPSTAETLYWLAFVQDRMGDAVSVETLRRADAASPQFVFPFRPESADVLEWAHQHSASWRPTYYLALLAWSRNDLATARALFASCGDVPDYAPFYAARAKALEPVSRDKALADLLRAARLDPREWRYGRLLTERYIDDRAFDTALATAAQYHDASPSSTVLGLLHVKALLLTGHFDRAGDELARMNVLPAEGATDARGLYREAHLMLAAGEFGKGRAETARGQVAAARLWPENLGAGKPYPEDVDERLEDWLEAQCLDRQGKRADARAVLDRLAGARKAPEEPGQLLAAMALDATGHRAEGSQALEDWARRQASPQVAEWGRRLFEGTRPAWPDGAPSALEYRVIVAWLGR